MANSNSVKTTNDWMSLFLGSSRSGGSGFSVSRYSSYSRDSDNDIATSRYNSRYSSVTSPTSTRRTYASPTYSSRYIPSSSSRWASRTYSDDEDEEEVRPRRQYYGRDVDKSNQPAESERLPTNQNSSETEPRTSSSRKQPSVTVLNEGTIIIRRQGAAETSDEEEESSESEPEPEEEPVPEEPPRDPLEVEEEMLNEKLQTAGFFLSMPEEEQIKKRLLEIKQMRDNPDWFKIENTKDYKYSQVSTSTAKPSTAKEEEEKILLLRLNSRGITEVEQTDVQVRLQEIWRDRREEVTMGIGRMEPLRAHPE